MRHIVRHQTPEVIAERQPAAVVLSMHQIEAESFAHRGEREVFVPHVDDGATRVRVRVAPSYSGRYSAAPPSTTRQSGKFGSNNFSRAMPPEYCHSCNGDGV